MTKADIELLADIMIYWRYGPWISSDYIHLWPMRVKTMNCACIAEQIEAEWRGF